MDAFLKTAPGWQCLTERTGVSDQLESLVAYCRAEGRVCPMPEQWLELWEMPPDKQREGSGWRPSPPLILAAWWDTSSLDKMFRLQEQLGWVEAHGGLEAVAAFLRGLVEDEWHHVGD